MFGYLGMTMLLASSWLTAWRFYVWAKREQQRAETAESDVLNYQILAAGRKERMLAAAKTRREGQANAS